VIRYLLVLVVAFLVGWLIMHGIQYLEAQHPAPIITHGRVWT